MFHYSFIWIKCIVFLHICNKQYSNCVKHCILHKKSFQCNCQNIFLILFLWPEVKFFFFFLPNYFYPHLAFTVLILDTVSSYWIPFEVIFDKIKLKVLLVRHLMESELMWKEAWTGRHITHSPSNINVKCLGWVIEWLKMIRQKRSRKCLTLWQGQPSVTLHLVYLSYTFVCSAYYAHIQ